MDPFECLDCCELWWEPCDKCAQMHCHTWGCDAHTHCENTLGVNP